MKLPLPFLNRKHAHGICTLYAKPKKRQLGARVKKALRATSLALAVLFFLLAIGSGIMEQRIGRMVLKEANKQLTTTLFVQKFKISLVRAFPLVSAQLEGVDLNDAFGKPLFKAQTVGLQFSLLSIFNDQITIRSIVIKDAVLVLKTDAKGRNNYHIFKSSVDDMPSSISLAIDKADLQNIQLVYVNVPEKQSADLTIQAGLVSGQFDPRNLILSSSADILVASVAKNGRKLLENKPLSYQARIAVDVASKICQFHECSVRIGAVPLQIRGLAQWLPQKGMFVDVVAENEGGSVADVLRLSTPCLTGCLKAFQTSGAFQFKAIVKGLVSSAQRPDVQAWLQVKNGRIASPKLKQSLEEVSFAVTFDNRNSTLEISNCTAVSSGVALQLYMKLVDLNNPSVSFGLNGPLPLGLAFGVLNDSRLTRAAGVVRCNGLKVDGRYADVISKDLLRSVQVSGNLVFQNASLRIDGEPIAANGVVSFMDNGVKVQNFNVKYAGSDATFTGRFNHTLPVMLSDSAKRPDLDCDVRLNAERLDLERLMPLAKWGLQRVLRQSYNNLAKGPPVPKNRQKIPSLNRAKGRLAFDVKNFVHNKISGRSLKGSLGFSGKDLTMKGSALAMGGGWEVDGNMELGCRPHLFAKLKTSGVDISEVFRQCDNFNQKVLKHENISGNLTSHVAINAYWDEGFKLSKDKLSVLADMNATNGELMNLKMLEGFSSYIKISDLRHIKFKTISNQFQIHEQKLRMPSMFIQSNALNLQISGEHTFNQEINYEVVVNVAQVLVNRLKPFNSRLEAQPDQRDSLFNKAYKVSGKIDDFKYSPSKESLRAGLAASEYRRNEIRAQLRRYFDDVLQ